MMIENPPEKNPGAIMNELFKSLTEIAARPNPFEHYTAAELWTDEHTSRQMLAYHLKEDVDLSSRRLSFIERSVAWMTSRFGIGEATKIADFGCGPGLYTTRLAEKRANVTGIDFSRRSLEYAQRVADRQDLRIRYLNRNYLECEIEDQFDLILMIMCDYCALSPIQRTSLLQKFRLLLKPEGHLLLDVYSLAAFEQKEETVRFEYNLLDGFWSADPYYGFLNVFKYDHEKVTLDKYTIIEPSRTRTIFNWLQYFSPETLEQEFSACGFAVDSLLGDVAGAPFNPSADEYAVIAQHH